MFCNPLKSSSLYMVGGGGGGASEGKIMGSRHLDASPCMTHLMSPTSKRGITMVT